MYLNLIYENMELLRVLTYLSDLFIVFAFERFMNFNKIFSVKQFVNFQSHY